ncbi:prephenate dehydratase [Candidatus Aerophobetes bacterium]|nr:prephenate dehydratase [Candidatus Aerophobetes bacterium]
MGIKKLRQEIDILNLKLLDILNERARKVLEIAKVKRESGKSYYSPAREKKILDSLLKENKGPLPNEDLAEIVRLIFKTFLSLEKKLKIAYLGPPATFTHLAAIEKFGKKVDLVPQKNIARVFSEVEKKQADFGVVPIENSMEGIVTYTLDMFLDSNLKIYAEIMMEISHCLLGKGRLEKIKKIYSHPQALAQCDKWLEDNLSSANLIEVESTAKAAQIVYEEPCSAAIASDIAASLYNLKILAHHIEDRANNYTRFFVIGRDYAERSGDDKTSIIFSIKDRVGALYDMLSPFRKHQLNLTKIESRPTKKKPWEYVFFVDFIGHKDDEKVKKALTELEEQCLFLKILGSYPREKGIE